MGGPSEVAGYEGIGEIYALYVDFAHHGRGIGRKLIQAAVQHLRPLGMTALIIRCLSTNAAGNRFYAALGGQLVGEIGGEEYGYPILEHIYHWVDSSSLLRIG
jgi:GNAT superfamily N-acetyltransferase